MIAFFDSGLGGLSIFRTVEKHLPHYDYLYLGDQLRTPYGGRSPEAIRTFTHQAVQYLHSRGANLIILACHTASSIALRPLQQTFSTDIQKNNWNILGVTIPLAEAACSQTKNQKIGVVGTRANTNSHVFSLEIKKIQPSSQVYEQACPLLVPLIEENWLHKTETNRLLRYYLTPLKNAHIDTLILGCTHYPLLFSSFQRKIGKQTTVLHSGKIIASRLADYLSRHPEIEKNCSKKGTRTFLTTDCPHNFNQLGSFFRGKPLEKVEKVTLPV